MAKKNAPMPRKAPNRLLDRQDAPQAAALLPTRPEVFLEEVDGRRQRVLAPWGPRTRPWKFLHTDGRYFEAVQQEGPVWVFRTREPPVMVPMTTVILTTGAACSVVGPYEVPTAELTDVVTRDGVVYLLHARHPDGFLHYHHDA